MSSFFAFISRTKFINRWSLMRNTSYEKLAVHSHEVAVIAHALAVIGNKRLNKNYDANKVAVIALYHDCSEIITGDMPTPIKYISKSFNSQYKMLEERATEKLLNSLPDDMREEYQPIMSSDDKELNFLVKAADKISALIKCVEEKKIGNHEFDSAYKTLLQSVKDMNCDEAEIFMDEFFDEYSMTLDELTI